MIRNRLYLGAQADTKLRSLQQRTQLTPNLLCRIGLCVSLEDPHQLHIELYDDGNVREFQMATLLGQHQELFLALLRERIAEEGRDGNDLTRELRAHISRGVIQLSLHCNKIEDLSAFIRDEPTTLEPSPLTDV